MWFGLALGEGHTSRGVRGGGDDLDLSGDK